MADFAISTGEEKLRATQSHATDQHLARHRGPRSPLQGARLGLAQGAGFGWHNSRLRELALAGTTLPTIVLSPFPFPFPFLLISFYFPSSSCLFLSCPLPFPFPLSFLLLLKGRETQTVKESINPEGQNCQKLPWLNCQEGALVTKSRGFNSPLCHFVF